jgi:hypothetical protein
MIMFDKLKNIDLPITFVEKEIATGGSERVPQTVNPDFFEDIDMEVRFESIPASVAFADREMARRDVDFGATALSTYMAMIHDDPVSERERAAKDKAGQMADELAVQKAFEIVAALAGDLAQQVAVQNGIPLPTQNPARPPTPMQGVGAPVVPPDQSQNGVPPSLGTEVVGAS